MKALMELKRNKNIKIIKVDKANATVILDKEVYHRKMMEHLACGSYKIIEKDSGIKIMKEVTKTIKGSLLDDAIKRS